MAYRGASFFATDSDWEVQRTNHFEFIIAHLTGGPNLTMAVESVKLPSVQISTTDLRHGNEIVKVATNPQYDGGSVTVKDAIGADIEMLIWNWYTKVLDVAGDSIMGLVVDYKRTARLIQWSPDNAISRAWRCTGVFPTSVQSGDFTYAQPDKKMISCNLSVDKAFPERDMSTTRANLPTPAMSI
jgi:hypothetical protein